MLLGFLSYDFNFYTTVTLCSSAINLMPWDSGNTNWMEGESFGLTDEKVQEQVTWAEEVPPYSQQPAEEKNNMYIVIDDDNNNNKI